MQYDNSIPGLYFSAHWCPPCRGFTPVLAQLYTKLKENNQSIEMIFVSSDRDENSFKEYFNEMPWHALPFSERDLKVSCSDPTLFEYLQFSSGKVHVCLELTEFVHCLKLSVW